MTENLKSKIKTKNIFYKQYTQNYKSNFLFLNPLSTNVPIIQKPVSWFVAQINWRVSISYMMETLIDKGLKLYQLNLTS